MTEDANEQKTLWIGDIDQWMDESYLMKLFTQVGDVINVKVIRDKGTMMPSGYGFVEFATHASAIKVLETYNGSIIPSASRSFRLNWASMGGSGGNTPRTLSGPIPNNDFAIYIGDLTPDVTDLTLQNAFATHYTTVKNAKIVTDPVTGASKGYGFVRFIDEGEKNRAMLEMQGTLIGGRPIRISGATPKKPTSMVGASIASIIPTLPQTSTPLAPATMMSAAVDDPSNTTILVTGLDPNVDEDNLRNTFAPFGELIYVNIPVIKGSGLVQFTHRVSAESAFAMNGTKIGTNRVKVAWGKGPKRAVPAAAAAYNAYYSYAYNPTTTGQYPAYDYYQQDTPSNTEPGKEIDFTAPPDVAALNKEDIWDGRMDRFTKAWSSRAYHDIVPDHDGPDALVV